MGAARATGLSAKGEEAGGIDLIVIYNSGRYRMAGRGSLAGLMPYGDANSVVMEMAGEVLPVVRNTPVLAGVCASDPFRLMDKFLDEVKATGFAGVQNFPTVGLIDGNFRANLEETGMSYQLEVDMIRMAHEKDLLTTPYVFSNRRRQSDGGSGCRYYRVPPGTDDRRQHRRGDIAETVGLPGHLSTTGRRAALDVNPEAIVLVHGGPVAMPEDAEFVLKNTRNCHGFYGASSMERLPTEIALVEQTRKFKEIRGS